MNSKQSLGKFGEELAVQFLKDHQYQILEQNWRSGRIELDIIAKKDNLIVFVEVKTRKSDYYGHPEESVDTKKQKHILDAANDYLIQHQFNNEIRFDIISIIKNSNEEKIYHIEDAIIPNGL